MAKKNDKIQVPISSEKKELLTKLAMESGFDSATDLLKFLINSFINGDLVIGINHQHLTYPKAKSSQS